MVPSLSASSPTSSLGSVPEFSEVFIKRWVLLVFTFLFCFVFCLPLLSFLFESALPPLDTVG